MKSLYLILDLFTLSIPLISSFDRRLSFYKKWKYLFAGVAITGAFFITWDVIFTYKGIWGFNDDYITGVNILGLPIEEWLFFIMIPYACVFVYEASRFFIKRDLSTKTTNRITLFLIIVLLITGILNIDKIYTSFTFIATSVFLLIQLFYLKGAYMGRFYIGYAINLIPFLLVNGILTGSFIKDQVVWYNNAENSGMRIGTIPVEDSIYLLLLLGMIITIYEERQIKKRSKEQGARSKEN